MKPGKVLGVVILLAAVAVMIYTLAFKATAPEVQKDPAVSAPAAAANDPLSLAAGKDALIVYYLHGTWRCRTCLAIEADTRKVLENVFAAELASGAIRWASVDYDAPENAHFKKDFELSSSAVLLARVQGGRVEATKKCEKVWELKGEPFQFEAYLSGEIRSLLPAKAAGQ